VPPELHLARIAPRPSFASGPEKSMIFLLVALQVQQHEVLFASLKRTIYVCNFAPLWGLDDGDSC